MSEQNEQIIRREGGKGTAMELHVDRGAAYQSAGLAAHRDRLAAHRDT